MFGEVRKVHGSAFGVPPECAMFRDNMYYIPLHGFTV